MIGLIAYAIVAVVVCIVFVICVDEPDPLAAAVFGILAGAFWPATAVIGALVLLARAARP